MGGRHVSPAGSGGKSILRFITCGSVDDGKSTLIGRLLVDTGAVAEDQVAALERESRLCGTRGKELDFALLLDGLQAERQQGITIDVAYRFFSTGRRTFVVADTPGHVQYTRNMATGASTAEVAVILVDARKGILSQTMRHARIVALMGIRHVLLAVNKMDLVGYGRERFEAIAAEFRRVSGELGFESVTPIPMAAIHGDGVTRRGEGFAWYDGPTLLEFLEGVETTGGRTDAPFRMPVQWVNRPHQDFRGYAGTIASGTVRPGDEVMVAPSGIRARVGRIVTMDGDLPLAREGDAVTLTLTEEIDVCRGDMLVDPSAPPTPTRHPEAWLVWMGDEPLSPGRLYWLKSGTATVPARVIDVRYRVEVESGERRQSTTLGLNDIGVVRLELDRPLAFDPYRQNRTTGSFILIDRLTNATVAGGMVVAEITAAERGGEPDDAAPAASGEVVVPVEAWGIGAVPPEGVPYRFVPTPSALSHVGEGGRISLALRSAGGLAILSGVLRRHGWSMEVDPLPDRFAVTLFRRGLEIAVTGSDGGEAI